MGPRKLYRLYREKGLSFQQLAGYRHARKPALVARLPPTCCPGAGGSGFW